MSEKQTKEGAAEGDVEDKPHKVDEKVQEQAGHERAEDEGYD